VRAQVGTPAGAPTGNAQPVGVTTALGELNAAYAPQVAAETALLDPSDPRKGVFLAETDTLVRAFSCTSSDITRDYGVYVVASNNERQGNDENCETGRQPQPGPFDRTRASEHMKPELSSERLDPAAMGAPVASVRLRPVLLAAINLGLALLWGLCLALAQRQVVRLLDAICVCLALLQVAHYLTAVTDADPSGLTFRGHFSPWTDVTLINSRKTVALRVNGRRRGPIATQRRDRDKVAQLVRWQHAAREAVQPLAPNGA